MRQTPNCFGKSGNRECSLVFCNDSSECYNVYLKYFKEKKLGFNVRLEDIIEKYCKENKIKRKVYTNERRLKRKNGI